MRVGTNVFHLHTKPVEFESNIYLGFVDYLF